jgi:hypothetical protein
MTYVRDRTVRVGPHATIAFDDERTVRHRIAVAFRPHASAQAQIDSALDACAALIPDGTSFTASLLVTCGDDSDRRPHLPRVAELQHRVWVQIEHSARVFGMLQEEVDPSLAGGDADLRFLRFDLEKVMVRELKRGSRLSLGIDHPTYSAGLVIRESLRRLLLDDLR